MKIVIFGLNPARVIRVFEVGFFFFLQIKARFDIVLAFFCASGDFLVTGISPCSLSAQPLGYWHYLNNEYQNTLAVPEYYFLAHSSMAVPSNT